MRFTENPLVPRNPGGKLFAVVLGRISTEHQDIENIDASYRYVQDHLNQMYDGPIEIRFLGEQASGMRTDRETIREAEDLVGSRVVDLVIAEDLSRIYRNPRHQYNFVQDAVDAGTRVICIGDNLDTEDENWEITLGAAALRHGLFIPDTRRRIRRTAKHSFEKGGMVQQVKFGYRKLTAEEADSGEFGTKGLRIAKLADYTPIIRAMRERVMRTSNFESVSDWLVEEGVPPGPNVRNERWTGKLVADLLRDPILSGTRRFRQMLYKPIFETGKHRREKNPEPETKEYPELAHMTRNEQEAMWAVTGGPDDWEGGQPVNPHPRSGVARSRSLWPGQSAICGACGGEMWLMGKFLKCENSLKRHGKTCWNHVQVNVDLVRDRMIDWLLTWFDANPELREIFVDSAWHAIRRLNSRKVDSTAADNRALASLQKQAKNMTKAIADGGQLTTLLEQLKITESRIKDLQKNVVRREESVELDCQFTSKEDVEDHVDVALRCVAASSFEFADLMRRFFPEFVIRPVQALDTGLVRPRGQLRFQLPDDAGGESDDHDRHWIELDFFESPKHIAIVVQCTSLKTENPKLSLRKIAEQLVVSYMTIKRALKYGRLMQENGVTDPYRPLFEHPDNASRWR